MPVLFEDDDLIVVMKPPGMSVHGGAGETAVNVIDLLRLARKSGSLHLIHRLDKGTSGVLAIAKSKGSAAQAAALWEHATKTYLAVAAGAVERAARLRDPLTTREGRAQTAETSFVPVAALVGLEPITTLVRIELGSGRLHQIRRHLASEGHPVVLDRQHGCFSTNRAFADSVRATTGLRPKHPMLHAAALNLPHPRGRRTLSLRAELPETWLWILRAGGLPVDLMSRLT